MPTIITHAAVPLAIGLGLGSGAIPRRLLVAGVIASMLPDLDVVAFRLGIAYSDSLGHRGFSHSLAFAATVGALAGLFSARLKARLWVAFAFVFLAAATHGLLDMLTNGGLGVAWLWPLSEQRFFLPDPFIQVAPLSLARFIGPAGLAVAKSELFGVWLPAFCVLVLLLLGRRWFGPGGRTRNRPGRKAMPG